MTIPTIKPPEIIESIGCTPVFWERNVAFVANLQAMFFGNEEETRMLSEEVGEVDSYGGRLLPMLDFVYAGPGKNLLVLERSPDPHLVEFFAGTAGLSLPGVEILPNGDYLEIGRQVDQPGPWMHPAIRRLGGQEAEYIDGYVTDRTLVGLAKALGMKTISSHKGSLHGNNKWRLFRHLIESGLPVPPTEVAERSNDVPGCLAVLAKAGFSAAVVRAPLGASGIGLIKVESLDEEGSAVSVPEHFFTEGPCLVQGWLQAGEFGVEAVHSPSVQLFLSEESVALYDITEQILSRASVHEGNESPPGYLDEHEGLKDELLRQAGISGRWLHGQGYRGTASVDFLVTIGSDAKHTVYVCEINARVTGATYPSVLARNFLPDGVWLMRNLRFEQPLTGKELLDLLRTSGDLFVPGQSEYGVFPLNFNFGRDGLVHKGQFLCLATSARGSKILLRMAQLDLPCRIDRD